VSYTLLVQGSKPLGYWKLNGTGIATVGSNANVSNGIYTTPPLISNSGSSLLVNKTSSSVTINNVYDGFYRNFDDTTTQIEFWFSFNGTLNGNGYPGSLSSASQYYVNNILKIVKIMNGSTEIGLIYYDYSKNTFRFKINGVNNTEAYIPVRNLHTNFYILAGFSNKKITITVNGEDGVSGFAYDISSFPSKTTTSTYQIDGSSINDSSKNFVVSDFSIYNYFLNKDQQRRRVVIGFLPDKPTSITSQLESSLFNFYERDYQVLVDKYITGNLFNSEGIYKNNIIIDEIEGIQYKRIPKFFISDFTPSGSVIITSSGVKMANNVTALQMSKYGNLFSGESYKTITAQISGVVGSLNTIFSLPEVIDNQSTIYVYAASNGFYLNSYDPVTSTSSNIFTLSTNLNSSSVYNFGLSIWGENIYLYGAGITASGTINNLKINPYTSIYVGNNPYSTSANNIYIKNLGMNNINQTTFSGYDFTENKMFMSRFNTDFSVSQISTWITNIPLSHFNSDIVGSKVFWTSMDNCMVQYSQDGTTWSNIFCGEQLPINYNTLNNDILLKVTVPYEYEIENVNQSFSNLNITLYRDLSFVTMDGKYLIQPLTDSSGQHSYAVKKNPEPILNRLNKFGLHFDRSSGTSDGYAVITPTSSAYQPYAIDFWFKADAWPQNQNYILDQANGGGSHPSMYIEQNTGHLRYGSGSVYVNGIYYQDNSNSFSASTGQYYHFFYDFGGPAASSIYINGKYQNSSFHTHASYGYINLWNSQVSPSTASSRYLHFISNNIQVINDTPSQLWQSSYYNDALTSVSSYKIG
jgi:hypothetical protein